MSTITSKSESETQLEQEKYKCGEKINESESDRTRCILTQIILSGKQRSL
ncbi:MULTISPECIES: hypothetical protein [unclassified Coleofasciculus]|nr:MULTISPECIES: hypothetical protein [unclassified Coleofasciculus]MBD1880120.1 hypothetical protein [Coleofasciculus sp. FACHB-T130]MBD1901370.1 hypothetical protein [Coleofasciculus sp. FACHB-125]